MLEKGTVSIFNCRRDYNNAYFGKVYLTDSVIECSFSECTFCDCEILQSTFRKCVFYKSWFKGTGRVLGCNFTDCKIETIIVEVPFDLCKWVDCNLNNISANKTSFFGNIWKTVRITEHSYFDRCNFTNNKMVDLKARNQDFQGCNFSNSYIMNCDLSKANLQGACLEGVDRSNSSIDKQYLIGHKNIRPPFYTLDVAKVFHYKKNYKGDFKNKNYNCCVIKECKYTNSVFQDCKFVEATIMSDFIDCEFKQCSLVCMRANTSCFINCSFIDCDFAGASMCKSLMKNCSIDNTLMEGLDVSGARFQSCVMNNCYAAGWKTTNQACIFKDTKLSKVVFIGGMLELYHQGCDVKEINITDCNFDFSDQ